ncbi:MAG: hypothetical protein Q9187_003143 [Circinaria calcarea]
MQNGLGHEFQAQAQHEPSGQNRTSTTPDSSQNTPVTPGHPQRLLNHEDTSCEVPDEGLPSKKRKRADSAGQQRSVSKPLSPPWKKVTVEGPTSFVEGGRRKSSRTNAVPLELQPQAAKRQTRAAIQQTHTIKSKYASAPAHQTLPKTSTQGSTQMAGKAVKAKGICAPHHLKESPSKLRVQNGVDPNLHSDSTPATRHSYKKKGLPLPSSPLPSGAVPVNPHHTRRLGRPPKSTTSNIVNQTPTRNRWHASDEDEKVDGENSDNGEDQEEQDMTLNNDEGEEELRVGPKFKPQRLKLSVRMPEVTVQHPGNVTLPRRYSSFRHWIQEDNPLTGDDGARLTSQQAKKEARIRHRIFRAAEPGGVLSPGKCSVYVPDPQDEPPQHYAHKDHLLAHAVYFRKLMNREHRRHIADAKKLAYAAAAMWKRSQPQTLQEIQQEKMELTKARYSQLMQDLSRKWEMAKEEVHRQRLEKWEEEQQALGKQALNRVLEQSTKLLHKRRRRGSAGTSIAEAEEGDQDSSGRSDDSSGGEAGSESVSEDEDNMSSSQSDSEEGSHSSIPNDDERLSVDELRKKYAKIPTENLDRPPDTDQNEDPMIVDNSPNANGSGKHHWVAEQNCNSKALTQSLNNDAELTTVSLEEVDQELLDNSDESTDMEDDMGDSDEPSEDSGEAEDGDDDSPESEEEQGLLGFFKKKQLQVPEKPANGNYNQQLQDDGDFDEEIEEVSLIPDATQVRTPSASNSEAPSIDASKGMKLAIDTDIPSVASSTIESNKTSKNLLGPSKPSLLNELAHLDTTAESQQDSLPMTPVSSQPLKTQVPSPLRGTLREYQHYGLDWLAGLYANKTNGILADEMGLGKTIQTISLLAHLAVEHEVWGPHLIVVPTSVMLNWEMEFKKFLPAFKILTYYGTQEERKQKRKGWLDDDKWNVCITSYQLVLQDQITFKKRGWHYLVLDEAHNIKNFRSQRWQALLTFRTQARLLLTGTPLQNNLTELWSLMFFLMPSDSTDTGISGFADLQAFTSWFKKPVDQILEQGRDTMDDEAKELVRRLHGVLRPYLLRRLKADVEKQMPGKYEHVVYCKLSKRQRYLYDGFMSRAQTRETLASGNYLSIINCLMQLRKVCNHPDLFETRQIVTSFAMSKSAIADFEIKELLVRRRLLQEDPMQKVDIDVVNLLPGANGPVSALDTIQNCRLGALGKLRQLVAQQYGRILTNMPYEGTSIDSCLAYMENTARTSTLERLRHNAYLTSLRSQRRPLYSYSLMERLRLDLDRLPSRPYPKRRSELLDWFSDLSPAMGDMVLTLPRRSEALQSTIQKFACVTPAVIAPDLTPLTLSQPGIQMIREAQQTYPADSFHEARMRLSIAFPDKRLLQYDCGKLQRLDVLLRTLQAGGHRALIFTQMTKVLDILEQFLNIHGHRYLRLDGSTKIEQRQILTDRFNSDNRILAFILSSRSGGLGINLTGADTVIFYDLDWNPAMDKQCQDRCHRIGQTRDVHIYRFVSEYTIEANILRKANQKRMLDDVIIQEGDFTTDYFNKPDIKDAFDNESLHEGDAEASAAMDRVLGAGTGRGKLSGQIFEQAEDKEDIAAAKVAEKELVADDADFDEKTASAGAATPRTPGPYTPGSLLPPSSASLQVPGSTLVRGTPTLESMESNLTSTSNPLLEGTDEAAHDVDDYILAHVQWELQDVPVMLPVDKGKKKPKKGGEHRVRKR